MKLKSKDGIEMMDIKSISQDGDNILVKGKMMGAMATTIIVTPEAVWDAFKLFPMRLLVRLPLLLFRGRRASLENGNKG